ncbi:tenascin C [Tieghemostelium lacteum]|uniref:Tenascin C n=1 Tax=Tieghemostelium lacteum TaxID=361077 RepID=A0A151Z7L3_TIELA|nr:tenascin C [Tieghemostelium lacteum]|eukprot:KYQ89774.1 tenascin C [Tieghemostelium lacteum]
MGSSGFNFICIVGSTGSGSKIYALTTQTILNSTGSSIPLPTGTLLNSLSGGPFPSVDILAIAAGYNPGQCFVKTSSTIFQISFSDSGITSSYASAATSSHPNQFIFAARGSGFNAPNIVMYSISSGGTISVSGYLLNENNDFQTIPTGFPVTIGTAPISYMNADGMNMIIKSALSTNILPYSTYISGTSSPVTSVTFDSVFTRTGLFLNSGFIYSCAKNASGVYLEALSSYDMQVMYNFITVDNINCVNFYSEPFQIRMIVSAIWPNNLYGFAYVGKFPADSQSETTTVTPAITIPANPVVGDFQLGFYTPYRKSIFSAIPSVGILKFDYTSFCTDDCNNHGVCNFGNEGYTCTCTQDNSVYFYGTSCDKQLPKITYVKTPYFGGLTTITGNYFASSDVDYTISINNGTSIVCSNMQFINTTAITCNFDRLYSDPTSVLVASVYSLNVQGAESGFGIASFYATPIVTSVTQNNDQLTLTGTNFLAETYQSIAFGTNTLSCQSSSTQTVCGLSSTLVSGVMKGNIKYGNMDIFYNQNYNFRPWITGTLPQFIPTDSSVVVLQGILFTANPTDTYKVNFAGQSISVPPGNITSTSITVTFPDGIPVSRQLSIVVGDNLATSNSYSIVYNEPDLTQCTQDVDTHNKFTITGSNFGNLTQLVTVSVEPVSGIYNATVLSVSKTSIEIQLPNDAEKGLMFATVAEQDSNSIVLNLQPKITGITSLPSTNGSNSITIQGEYLKGTQYTFNGVDITCTAYSTLNYPNSWAECTYPSGSGTIALKAFSSLENQVLTSEYQTHYKAPSILTISPSSYKKSQNVTFVITGYDIVFTDIYITIQGEDCLIIENNLPANISCNLKSEIDPSTIQNPVSIKISSNGIVGYNNATLIYEKSCMNSCSSQGTCDVTSGKCQCNDGFTGDDCSTVVDTSSDISSSPIIKITLLMTILFNLISIFF